MMNRREAAREAEWRAELERKARGDLERIAKRDEGKGRGL